MFFLGDGAAKARPSPRRSRAPGSKTTHVLPAQPQTRSQGGASSPTTWHSILLLQPRLMNSLAASHLVREGGDVGPPPLAKADAGPAASSGITHHDRHPEIKHGQVVSPKSTRTELMQGHSRSIFVGVARLETCSLSARGGAWLVCRGPKKVRGEQRAGEGQPAERGGGSPREARRGRAGEARNDRQTSRGSSGESDESVEGKHRECKVGWEEGRLS